MTTPGGRVASVTGAGHGVGHATAVALAQAGAAVAAVDIMDPTEADRDRIMRVNGEGVLLFLQRAARPSGAASVLECRAFTTRDHGRI